MKAAVQEISRWLLVQLSDVPDKIRAVYVEWGKCYLEPNTPREVVLVSMDAFGFEGLSKGGFDCSDPDDLARLGDFGWEGRSGLRLRESDYPGLNWTNVLKRVAATREVRKLVCSRNLLLLVGYHDDAVYDVS
jgi:hypothetical protein